MGEPRIYCPTQATLSVKASLLIIRLETDVEQDFLWRISICGDSRQRRSTVRRRGQPSAGRAAYPPPPTPHFIRLRCCRPQAKVTKSRAQSGLAGHLHPAT